MARLFVGGHPALRHPLTDRADQRIALRALQQTALRRVDDIMAARGETADARAVRASVGPAADRERALVAIAPGGGHAHGFPHAGPGDAADAFQAVAHLRALVGERGGIGKMLRRAAAAPRIIGAGRLCAVGRAR